MTLKEKLAIDMKAIEMARQGNHEEFMRIEKTIPLAPYMAKWVKDHLGAKALIESGWNLSEAEAEYGPGWLSS
jgi:hypothetical protein